MRPIRHVFDSYQPTNSIAINSGSLAGGSGRYRHHARITCFTYVPNLSSNGGKAEAQWEVQAAVHAEVRAKVQAEMKA